MPMEKTWRREANVSLMPERQLTAEVVAEELWFLHSLQFMNGAYRNQQGQLFCQRLDKGPMDSLAVKGNKEQMQEDLMSMTAPERQVHKPR